MSYSVYLRPLKPEDAGTSWRWRNNPNIWLYTKFRPPGIISAEMEASWLSNCLQRSNEHRFAICLEETHQYVGNIQLINIRDQQGEFHVFIGEENCWNKGIARKAGVLLLEFAFEQLKLETVVLQVHPENKAAIAVYEKIGFCQTGMDDDFIEMSVSRSAFGDAGWAGCSGTSLPAVS